MAVLRRNVPLTDVSVGRLDLNAPIFGGDELCDNFADSDEEDNDEPDDTGDEDDEDDAEESVN